jgi:hypothetical protein
MKRIASVMLDLPEPLGPVIHVNPGPRGTGNVAFEGFKILELKFEKPQSEGPPIELVEVNT